MKEIVQGFLGISYFLLIICFLIAQVVAGYVGIDHHLGAFWAIVAVILIPFFRVTLPITIGAFFGATNVWGWHWIIALIFCAPGILFIIPSIFISILTMFKK